MAGASLAGWMMIEVSGTAAARRALAGRSGLQHTSSWARVTVLTRGGLGQCGLAKSKGLTGRFI